MPARNSGKNASTASVRGGRESTSPHAFARDAESERAALFGRQPSSSAISRMRFRVSSDSPGRPFRAYETAPFDTPARRAMSLIVTLRPERASPATSIPAFHVRATLAIGMGLIRVDQVWFAVSVK